MERRHIVFYRSPSGRCPIEEFLDSLSSGEAKRIAWLLELLRDIEKIPESYLKKLQGTEGIWEGRVQFGSRSFRVLGFFLSGSRMVITHGFAKKSKKTPQREIETAERFKREYLDRANSHG
jgi:phage-related protein